jgi:hypothetical protein
MSNDFATEFDIEVPDAVRESTLEPAQQAQADADIADLRSRGRRSETTRGGDPLHHAPGLGVATSMQRIPTNKKGRTIGILAKNSSRRIDYLLQHLL